MNDARSRSSHTPSAKGLAWAFVPVALLGSMFVGWGAMVAVALDDPAFGVEPDYYDKAVHFDEHQARARESQRLGWRLDVTPQLSARRALIRVTLKDAELRPIDGASVLATAFHIARSSQVHRIQFRSEGDGRYTQTLAPFRQGQWEFRFEVLRGSQRFLEATRVSLETADDS